MSDPGVAVVRAQVGRAFPGGEFVVEPWLAWLFADAALAEPGGEVAHPVLAWTAATQAMGVGWDEFFAWFDACAEDGPLFGEHETVLHEPMRVGGTYMVSGCVTSADRKTGRSAGTFDIVDYRLAVHDKESGRHVADCWNSIIFPRRN
ncbi:hypothetical protein ACFS2C_07080 [Prauserella oleivorans]|uniref:N-terminal of MaoC-like dehydratase domain-containing protein n=1 Tax=Prauserella oleivorans TaxID=1478153 RepID=A0ABW5W992_9PSEU